MSDDILPALKRIGPRRDEAEFVLTWTRRIIATGSRIDDGITAPVALAPQARLPRPAEERFGMADCAALLFWAAVIAAVIYWIW